MGLDVKFEACRYHLCSWKTSALSIKDDSDIFQLNWHLGDYLKNEVVLLPLSFELTFVL